MATDSLPGDSVSASTDSAGRFALSSRRRRTLREQATAYIFLAPAAILLFTFGIFPIFYAGYVSLYQWRIRQGEYRGLANFVSAMGDVAYVFIGIVALALVVIGVNAGIKALREAREADIPRRFPLLALIPGAINLAGLVLIFLSFITFFTQDNAIEAGEARELGNIPVGLLLLIIAGFLNYGLSRWQHQVAAKTKYSVLPSFTSQAVVVWLTVGGGLALAWFTYNTIVGSEQAAGTWLKLRAILIGLAQLGIAYAIWTWAMRQFSLAKFIGGTVAAAAFIGGGVYLLNFWPVVSQGSDPDFYLSMAVTVYYAVGAVPVQLIIALVLAYLLFQDLKGKGFFRVAFFIPYVAPTVAGAAIFDVLFSLREYSLANRFMQFITGNELLRLSWLQEPGSAIATIGEAFGFGASAAWEFGPSLALLVIILFSIWRFVGYDTVIFLAGLGNIPGVLYEAAEIDGANRWQVFRHITIPLLSPTTFFLSVISVIGTFKAFNSIWVLRNTAALGTTDTASIYFFATFFRGARFGYATSMAMILFVIILTLTIIQNRLAERRVFYG
jgi:multiple sugar transport system permease protein